MKKFFLTAMLALITAALAAQDNEIVNLRLETRFDYQQEYLRGGKADANSGFKGKYLNIRMDGTIAEGLTYSYRQRLNKPNRDASFFDATDWMTLTYSFGNWSVSGGKQVVAIGGYEYDAAPIDLYFCSEYWNNIPCYQIGVSGAYTTKNQDDKILFQICQSPFRTASQGEMFAYNAIWYGTHGFFSSIYSLNFIEYLPGKYINYITLGNRFTINEFIIDLDIMNRAVDAGQLFGRDYSVMGTFKWKALDCLNVFAKVTHDFNNSNLVGDWCVMPGTSITRAGLGVEYYPIRNSTDLRIHLNYCYTDGDNGNPAGSLLQRQNIIDAGITWKMNMLKIKK